MPPLIFFIGTGGKKIKKENDVKTWRSGHPKVGTKPHGTTMNGRKEVRLACDAIRLVLADVTRLRAQGMLFQLALYALTCAHGI